MDSINNSSVFISNYLNNFIKNADTSVNNILDNKYLFIVIVVFTLLFGSLHQSRLSSNILTLYSSTFSRLLMIGFIYYISTKNITLALLMLTATVVLMNTESKNRFNIMLVSLFNNSLFNKKKLSKKRSKRFLFKRKSKKMNLIDRLLKQKKITRDDAIKLKNINTRSLIEIANSPEFKSSSRSSSPKLNLPSESNESSESNSSKSDSSRSDSSISSLPTLSIKSKSPKLKSPKINLIKALSSKTTGSITKTIVPKINKEKYDNFSYI